MPIIVTEFAVRICYLSSDMRIATCLLAAFSALHAEDFGFRVIMGHGDKLATAWDGSASARGASIARIEPWRFEAPDGIEGNSWKAQIRSIRLFGAANRQGAPPAVASGVVIQLTGASASSEVEVKTAQGDFTIRASDVPFGKTLHLMNGRVSVDRVRRERDHHFAG